MPDQAPATVPGRSTSEWIALLSLPIIGTAGSALVKLFALNPWPFVAIFGFLTVAVCTYMICRTRLKLPPVVGLLVLLMASTASASEASSPELPMIVATASIVSAFVALGVYALARRVLSGKWPLVVAIVLLGGVAHAQHVAIAPGVVLGEGHADKTSENTDESGTVKIALDGGDSEGAHAVDQPPASPSVTPAPMLANTPPPAATNPALPIDACAACAAGVVQAVSPSAWDKWGKYLVLAFTVVGGIVDVAHNAGAF